MVISKKAGLRATAIIGLVLSVALFLAVKLFAIENDTPIAESKVLNQAWHFTGSTNTEATNPAFYEQGASPDCEGGTDTVCEISAPVDPSSNPGNPKPDMDAPVTGSETVEDQILDALDNGTNDTVTSLRGL